MALIVEDGSGLVDSNTYADEATVRAYALARGVTLPADDSEVDALIFAGMDYIEAQRARFKGEKTYPENPQALQWPRKCVEIDGYPFPENAIPKELVAALSQCAMEVFAGNDLSPTTTGAVVKREKVDVLETEYMTAVDMGGVGSFEPQFPKVDSLMAPLYNSGGKIRTVRV